MAKMELRVPDIGDFKEVEVIEVLVKPGDVVVADQSLVTVESDKASMEIPASAGGVVVEWLVKVGDKIGEGSLLGSVEAAGLATGATGGGGCASWPHARWEGQAQAGPGCDCEHGHPGGPNQPSVRLRKDTDHGQDGVAGTGHWGLQGGGGH